MVLQTYIALAIVFTAVGVGVYRIIKYLANPLKKCSGCGKGCSGCSLEELKHEIELKKHKKVHS